MCETETKGDFRPLDIEKKSEESKKNKIHNLQNIDEDEDSLRDLKLKPVLNEEDDDDEDVSKDKKLKSVLNEDEDENGDDDGDVSKDKKLKSVLNEDEDEDVSKDKKLKSVVNEDEDEDDDDDDEVEDDDDEDEDEDEKSKGHDGNLAKKRKHEATENESKSKVKSKKIRFSGQTPPSSDTENEDPKTKKDNIARGKRFTPEEDKILQDAILRYIVRHNLGEDGLEMVLNCKSHPKIKKCWKEIHKCIPYRPKISIYNRAHCLYEQGKGRKWTKEETDILQECYKKHGNNWKMIAIELGKSLAQVKNRWRYIKLNTRKVGKWSQEEYQNLYDLVNLNLQLKVASQEKRSTHGMLRDDIRWGAISDKLTTRAGTDCCSKWYKQLTSSLVAEEKWANVDDYRLIKSLYDLDANCVEDVDWDGVLEYRDGDVCRKRWDQMVRHIGHHGSKPFSEQVDILSRRYCPDLAETVEVLDSVPSKQ